MLSIILLQLMLVYVWLKTLHAAHQKVDGEVEMGLSLSQVLLWDSVTMSYKLIVMTGIVLVVLFLILAAIDSIKGFNKDKDKNENENVGPIMKYYNWLHSMKTGLNFKEVYEIVTKIAFNFRAAFLNVLFAIVIVLLYQSFVMSQDDFKNKEYMHMHIDIVMFLILFFDVLIFVGVYINKIG